jgi:hypothetical protein
MKFAHIISVTEINESKKASYLHIAQPVTMKTMVAAKEMAQGTVDVDLLAIKHKSESISLEPGFTMTPDIDKYAWEYIDKLIEHENKKPLPRLTDILNAAYQNSDADYLIYTNLDIGLQPYFYCRVKELIEEGFDAICINRRDLDKKYEGQLLDESCIDIILPLEGELHPGIDCMIFKRNIFPKFQLNNVFIGFPPIGQVLKTQMDKYSKKSLWVKEEKLSFHIGRDLAWQGDGNKSVYWLENEREAKGLFIKQFGRKQSTYEKLKIKLSGNLNF